MTNIEKQLMFDKWADEYDDTIQLTQQKINEYKNLLKKDITSSEEMQFKHELLIWSSMNKDAREISKLLHNYVPKSKLLEEMKNEKMDNSTVNWVYI